MYYYIPSVGCERCLSLKCLSCSLASLLLDGPMSSSSKTVGVELEGLFPLSVKERYQQLNNSIF